MGTTETSVPETDLFQDVKAQLLVSELVHLGFPHSSPMPCLYFPPP